MRQTSRTALASNGLLAILFVLSRKGRARRHFVVGQVWETSGETERAVQEYKVAVSLWPGLDRGHLALGRCHLRLLDLDRAKAALSACVDLNRSDPEANLYYGVVLFYRNDFEGALKSLRIAVNGLAEGDPKRKQACDYLRRVQEKRRGLGDADRKGTGNQAMSRPREKGYFAVASTGCSACVWFAGSLNMHPDILCTVGIADPRICVSDDEQNLRILDTPLDLTFNDMVMATQENLRYWPSLGTMRKQARVFGNVHMFRVRTLRENIRRFSLDRNVAIANLVRHPVTRTEAHYYLWLGSYRNGLRPRSELEERLAAIPQVRDTVFVPAIRRFGFDHVDLEHQVFLLSLLDTIEANVDDFQLWPDLPVILMERLKTDRDYYCDVVQYLTNGRLQITPDYLDKVFSKENQNAGRVSGGARATRPPLGPNEQFEAWEDWQRVLFRAVMQMLDAESVFGRLGYDFSFVGR